MQNIDATLRDLLKQVVLANDSEMTDDAVKLIKKEILDSFNRGIATAKRSQQDPERRTAVLQKLQTTGRKS